MRRPIAVRIGFALVLARLIAFPPDALAGEIHNAAAVGDVQRIRQLLDNNPKLVDEEDWINLMGLTPLHVAADKGQSETVALLLARGAKVDPKWTVNSATPLFFAARAGHADVVKLLLAKGASPSAVANGTTALHWAAGEGHIEVVKLLLDGGADVNLRDPANQTPLHVVARRGTKAIAEFLIARGADVNAKDSNGSTPWNLTVDHPDIAEVLRKHGAYESEPVVDVVLNNGNSFTTSREITVDPLNDRFPVLRVRDWYAFDDGPVSVRNTGKPFKFALPDRGDGEYLLEFQFVDAAGQPHEPVIVRRVVVDTKSPVVRIMSPRDGESAEQGYVHLQATAYDPEPRESGGGERHYRRLSLWINGEAFWDRNGENIDVPRYAVKEGSKKIAIRAVDEAGNATEATVTLR